MGLYNLESIREISKGNSDYVLPEDVKQRITDLLNNLPIPQYPTPTPPSYQYVNQQKPNYTDNRIRSPNAIDNKARIQQVVGIDTVWEKQKAFVATKVEKKEGIEKLINDIRICLNKISNKNYDSQRETIFKYIDDIMEETDDENNIENVKKIVASIFETASTNKFYSILYAELYNDLVLKYPIFRELVRNFIDTYIESIHTIEYVEPEVNYDKHCLNNKNNDKRRAMSVFMVNLMKKQLLTKEDVINSILQLLELVVSYIDIEKKNYDIEEITENIFLFISTAEKELLEEPKWTIVYNMIKQCSQMKTKEHKSLTNRAVFKYKDICDLLKKIC